MSGHTDWAITDGTTKATVWLYPPPPQCVLSELWLLCTCYYHLLSSTLVTSLWLSPNGEGFVRGGEVG